MNELFAFIGIAIFSVFLFISTFIIFYLHSVRSRNTETSSPQKSHSNNNNEEGSSLHSMVSAESTLPFRSSSNFSLHSHTNKSTKSSTKSSGIRWIAISKIGSGGYSEVFHVINKDSKRSLAMKWIRIDKNMAKLEASQVLLKTFAVEAEILCKINHPNIIQYYGQSVAEHEMSIFLELAPCGNLSKFISVFAEKSKYSNNNLPEHLIQRFSIDVLSALSYLHSQSIIHRDIKCANLLVMNDGVIKLSDFGVACRLEETNSEKIKLHGTYNWMAPEMISATNQSPYDHKVDIWSFGCCLIEMSKGSAPWTETKKNGEILMYHIGTSSEIPKLPKTSNGLEVFMMNHLQRNPNDRLSASELLEHPFLNDNVAEMDIDDNDNCFKEILTRLSNKMHKEHDKAMIDMFMYGLDHQSSSHSSADKI